MTSLGVPEKLRGDSLPTKQQIYNHFLYLIQTNCSSGHWKQITSFHIKVTAVLNDVREIWDRTAIPHILESREGERRLKALLTKCKTLNKVPFERRDDGFAVDLESLFDVASCQHIDDVICTCDLINKVKS